jgi:tRNA threonylcarbamoyladenosine modification (KEOPS) complex  Pcc1 subunit
LKAKAVVRLGFPSKKHLDIFLKALEPEVKKPATTRSRASIKRKENYLILKIEARDTVALRATLNAFLRWINSVVNVLEVLEKAKM